MNNLNGLYRVYLNWRLGRIRSRIDRFEENGDRACERFITTTDNPNAYLLEMERCEVEISWLQVKESILSEKLGEIN